MMQLNPRLILNMLPLMLAAAESRRVGMVP